MKRFFIALFCIFSCVSTVAQDEDYPWTVGFGFNAVDYQTEGAHAFNTNFSAIRVSLGRHLWGQFSAEVSYAINVINKFAGYTDLNLNHSSLDLSVRYSLGFLVNRVEKGPIEPYLAAGAGRTWLQRSSTNMISSNTLHLRAGVNYWINPRLAVFGQASYKNSTDVFADTYHELVLGVRYNFKFKSNNAFLH